ncbi:hypothetical protein GCM10009804_63940 [Kribbella hippodromi]|uniref:Uncharacterized protein n=1 Tax=Kribbella hippodromi TaxID=434347 RepID=A0ABP4Q5J1_9ACTN
MFAFGRVEYAGGAVDPPAGFGVLEYSVGVVGFDLDALETGEGEQERVVGLGQQAAYECGGCFVAEREDDGGVVAGRRLTLGLERQPQHRHLPVSPPHFLVKSPRPQRPNRRRRIRLREPNTPTPRQHHRLITHGQHSRKPNPKPPNRQHRTTHTTPTGHHTRPATGTTIRRDTNGATRLTTTLRGTNRDAARTTTRRDTNAGARLTTRRDTNRDAGLITTRPDTNRDAVLTITRRDSNGDAGITTCRGTNRDAARTTIRRETDGGGGFACCGVEGGAFG